MLFMFVATFFLLANLLTNTVDVLKAIRNENTEAAFSLEGICILQNPQRFSSFILKDGTGTIMLTLFDSKLESACPQDTTPGNIVRVDGRISLNTRGFATARYDKISLIGHQMPPAPLSIRLSDLPSEKYDCQLIKTTGYVKDIFRDEIDPLWHFLIMTDGERPFYIPVFTDGKPPSILKNIIGAQIEITGVCQRTFSSPREFQGQTIFVFDPNLIVLLSQPPDDLFNVPGLPHRQDMTLDKLATLGRRRISGHVIAVRQNRQVVIRDNAGKVHNVEFTDSTLPAYGAYITISGFPETDLYHINFSGACWKHENGPPFQCQTVQDITLQELFYKSGAQAINPDMHGQLIRLIGTVNDKAPAVRGSLVSLQSEGFPVRIETETTSELLTSLSKASKIEVTGTYLIDCDNWHSYSRFPHITSSTIVPRTPDDIRIVSYAPWWTPIRLIVLIALLIAALIAILTWNRILNRLAERRGRELLKEQIHLATAELKVDERTRLAVELHDAIAQNLTGAEMEIETAEKLFDPEPKGSFFHLSLAKRMLHSSRSELRNCLWDLRSQAFEEPDFNTAIRRTLVPHIKDVKTTIRFNLPRSIFTENSIHTILRIIRELSINAITHGHASVLQIAGGIERDKLLFSVSNNGDPFDPSNAPGIQEGHFGLLGIRERLRKYSGTLEYTNPRDGWVKAKVTMHIQQPSNRPQNDT